VLQLLALMTAFGGLKTAAFGGLKTAAFGSLKTQAFGCLKTAFGGLEDPVRRPSAAAFGGLNTTAFGGLNTAAFGGLQTAGRSPADRMVDRVRRGAPHAVHHPVSRRSVRQRYRLTNRNPLPKTLMLGPSLSPNPNVGTQSLEHVFFCIQRLAAESNDRHVATGYWRVLNKPSYS